jgi:hypothetical protein
MAATTRQQRAPPPLLLLLLVGCALLLAAAVLPAAAQAGDSPQQEVLDPRTVPKYASELSIPLPYDQVCSTPADSSRRGGRQARHAPSVTHACAPATLAGRLLRDLPEAEDAAGPARGLP